MEQPRPSRRLFRETATTEVRMHIIPRNMPVRLAKARAATSEIDSFGVWISCLVVFASVTAVIVVWQNFYDHAYSLATSAHPHAITSALAEK